MRAVTAATYLRELPRLLRLCAARTAGELNITDLARDLGPPTTDSYLAHLEAVFLIQTIRRGRPTSPPGSFAGPSS